MQPKFLIVDDDVKSLDLLETILGSLGCTVERTDNGTRALEILHKEKRSREFDAVLVDLVMPTLSGYAVIGALRQSPETARLPIIAITAHDERDVLMEAYRTGADYLITKPFTAEQLRYGFDLLFGDETQPGPKSHFTKYDV